MGPIERGGMFLVHLEDAKKRMEHRGQHRGPQPSGPAVPAQHPPGLTAAPLEPAVGSRYGAGEGG
jgi:hypothetical protein